MRGLMIASGGSGAGKTTIAAALMRAYRDRGVTVAPAKSGPDYLDTGFHAACAGAPSTTLDAWAMDAGTLRMLAAGAPGELLLVEAAMGLLDGAPHPATCGLIDPGRDVRGRGAAADLAALLALPVVLVLDASGAAQSAAALAVGLSALADDVDIPGVILNRVGSPRHADLIARACAAAGFEVYGALPRDAGLATPSRHLGLVQARERADLEAFAKTLGDAAAAHLDLDRLLARAAPIAAARSDAVARLPAPLGQRIAVADDAAFAFAYPHLLAHWRASGASLSPFSPLADEAPAADADAIFLPGGYPELHAGALAEADRFRAGMRRAAGDSVRIYGECGGYMVLGDALLDGDVERRRMLGLLPVTTSFAARKLSLGYRRLTPRAGAPWTQTLRGHEFHYATIVAAGAAEPLFDAEDAGGAPLGTMGLQVGSVSGSFAHVISQEPAAP